MSSVSASEDGSSARFVWRYEGAGWKTDELQVKVWRGEESAVNPFSTLSQSFDLKAEVGEMYSFLLRPAPNIRTEEFVYGFVVSKSPFIFSYRYRFSLTCTTITL